MVQPITISKNNPAYPAYLDFTKLREEGVKHIETLAGKIWTDYNIHDPGITILEVLCYAITDLGYRTNFKIEDLLAKDPKEPRNPGSMPDNNFFTASEILSCNPLTEIDIRKRLLDIAGVRNAWLSISEEAEQPVYVNCAKSVLQYEPPAVQGTEIPVKLKLKGLYKVFLDLESDRVRDACGNEITSDAAIVDEVKKVLQKHRNLCEDYLNIIVLGEEQIGICTEIELAPNADLEDVLVEIYIQLNEFLSPPLHFYTLQELLDKGRTIEQIFEGRPLNDGSFGFIDVDDLEKLEVKTVLHASDLYQLIMKVPGVKAIKKLHFNNYINDLAQSGGDKWCLNLTPNYKPVFSIEESTITFFKGALPFIADAEEVKKRFEEKRASTGKVKLPGYQLDLPIPSGNYNKLADYTSIVHEFPVTYGIGESGLPDNATPERKGQANQLKAYLLFFDQLLASYLAQLSNMRGLFSMEQDNKAENLRTYFTQPLTGISNAEGIIKNYNYCNNKQDAESFKEDPLDYKEYLNFITEEQDGYYDRRSRLLDHLLARFSEQFTDYALLMFDLNGKKQDAQTIIDDKTDFLKQYPEISRNRGKGFDYTDYTRIWNTDNVPGLSKRVSKLMGVDDFNRRTLSPCIISRVDAAYYFELKDVNGKAVLKSRMGYPTPEMAGEAYENLMLLARDAANYRTITYDNFYQYGFAITDKNGNELMATPVAYLLSGDSANDKMNTINFFNAVSGSIVAGIATVKKGRVYYYQLSLNINSAAGINNQPGTVVLQSKKSFVKEESAMNAAAALLLDSNFLKYAKDDNRYIDVRQPGFTRHGFGIGNEAGEMVATYPEDKNLFLSAPLRDVYIMEVLGSIKNKRLKCSITAATQCYFFELYSADGSTLLLQSVTGYPSRPAAEKAYTAFVPIAREKANYNKFSSADGTSHGFSLMSGDETVATSPATYETSLERDNRIEAIVYYLSAPNYKPDPIRPNTAFVFEVKDEEGINTWLLSANNFPDQPSAATAFNEFLTAATVIERYRSLNHQPGEHRFGFDIVDATGKTVATHPYTYASRLERKLARLRTFYYLNQTEVLHNTPANGDLFTFELVDKDGNKWLVSENNFADATLAEAAYTNIFLPLAKLGVNYKKLDDTDNCKFSFAVTDANQNIIARYPEAFENEAERDMAILYLLNYMNTRSPEPHFFEQEINYSFQLLSPEAEVYFNSDNVYPLKEEALQAFDQLIELAKDKRNYVLTNKPGPGDSFSFTLKDAMDRGIASHPEFYATLNERTAVINKILYYVNNYPAIKEFPLKEGAYFFELPDAHQELIFSGSTNFSSTNEALAAFKQFLVLGIDEVNYRLLNKEGGNCGYGFELAGEQGKTIAVHPKWYATDTERAAAIRSAISFIDKPASAILLKYNYYTYYIKDEAGLVVLDSNYNYPDSLTAHKAYDAFLKFTPQPASYQLVRDPSGKLFGFTLVNDKGKVLANHPRYYQSEAEAYKVIERTINYIKAARAVETIDYSPASFRFLLKDASGNPLLEGFEEYTDEVTALEAYSRMLSLAAARENFRLFDDEENGEPYFGFELLDKELEVIATHPHTYHSEGERDAVINFIKQYVDPGAVVWDTAITEDKLYFFQLKDSTGEELLFLGMVLYNDKENAAAAFQDFVQLAQSDEYYHNLDDARACQYSFELLNKDKEVIASHPLVYASPGHRNQVKKNIIQYLKAPVTPVYEIVKKEAVYTYDLSDKDGTHLFTSKASFSSEDEVKLALKRFLELVNIRLNYFSVPAGAPGEFGLELRDETGVVIAVHPNYYASMEASEAVADSIFKKVSTSPMDGKVEEHDPYYTFELLDANGKTLLAAKTLKADDLGNTDRKFNTLGEAEAAYESMRIAATNLKNYENIYRNDLCNDTTVKVDDLPVHGFMLKDEKGEVIALHDVLYSSRKTRDDAIQRIIEYVDKHLIEQDDTVLEKFISGTDCAYHISIADATHLSTLFTGNEKYPSPIRAWPATLEILDRIAVRNNYKPIVKNNKQGIGIAGGQGTIIAEHPEVFDDPVERDLQVNLLYYIVNKPAVEYELVPVEAGYIFRISDPDDPKIILLESSVAYIDAPAALYGYHDAIALARQQENFHVIKNADGSYGFELQNTTGTRVAFHPKNYATETQASIAIKGLVEYVDNQLADVNPVITATTPGLTYQLVKTGAVETSLLTGTTLRTYENEDLVWKACDEVVELAQDKANFRSIKEEALCNTFLYRAALFNEANEVVGLSNKVYNSADDYNNAVVEIANQLNNNNEGLHLIEHLLLRPKTRALSPAYYLQFKDGDEILLTGTYNYADKNLAGEACNNISRLAIDKKNYKVDDKNPGKCSFGFGLTDATKNVIARPALLYPTPGDRDNAISALIEKFSQQGGNTTTTSQVTCEIRNIRDESAPAGKDDTLLKITVTDSDCNGTEEDKCWASMDPYSCWITVVLPYWPLRFRNINFRRFFENVLREETPAHVALRICWVSVQQMASFEKYYKNWLTDTATSFTDYVPCTLSQSQADLCKILFELKNVYPQANLFDCESSSQGIPFVLNQTMLGTSNSPKNGNRQ